MLPFVACTFLCVSILVMHTDESLNICFMNVCLFNVYMWLTLKKREATKKQQIPVLIPEFIWTSLDTHVSSCMRKAADKRPCLRMEVGPKCRTAGGTWPTPHSPVASRNRRAVRSRFIAAAWRPRSYLPAPPTNRRSPRRDTRQAGRRRHLSKAQACIRCNAQRCENNP